MSYPTEPQFTPPSQPPKRGGIKAFFVRKVTLPMWSLITVGIIFLIIINANSSHASNATTSTASAGSSATVQQKSTPKPPAPTATSTHTPQWTVVQSFSGSGSKKTSTFSVPDDWRIVWTCNPASYDGISYNVIVSVDNADSTPLDYAAINTMCKAGNTGDMTEEHQGGNVYLDINSEGDWTMQVQILK